MAEYDRAKIGKNKSLFVLRNNIHHNNLIIHDVTKTCEDISTRGCTY